MAAYDDLRGKMTSDQIALRGIRDRRIIEVFRRTPRHLFVPEGQRPYAYEDRPLPIGRNQTISQPYIVAYMTEQLELTEESTVLEVGTGSGYQAAILAQIAESVCTIEIVEIFFRRARRLLEELGYDNVECRHGDGYAGAQDRAPFDRIVLTAAAPKVPIPLAEQLAEGGILLMPRGVPDGYQELVRFRKHNGALQAGVLCGVRFVPMTGRISRRG